MVLYSFEPSCSLEIFWSFGKGFAISGGVRDLVCAVHDVQKVLRGSGAFIPKLQDNTTSFISKEESNGTTTMKEHTTGGLKNEDAEGAAWEGGKGALIGASKVWHGVTFLIFIFLDGKDILTYCVVGNCIWRSWWFGLCYVTYLQRVDNSI